MHKRLQNRQNLEKSSHQGFVNSLTSNFISQKYGVQNFSQEANRNFHAKFNAFLLCIFRPTYFNKDNYFPSLQFEFRLPLFFLKTLRVIPGNHRFEIQLQNNLANFIQFIKKNNYIHNNIQTIQTVQKYQPSIIKLENSFKFFHKSKQSLVAAGARKEYSESREQNIPLRNDNPLFINRVRVIHNDLLPAHSEKLFVNKFIRGNNIFSEAKRSQHMLFNKQQRTEALQIHRQTKTTDIHERFTTSSRFSDKFNGFYKFPVSPAKDGLSVDALQQKHVQSIKPVSISFINEGDLPDLIHRKPAESIIEPKSEHQIATADQHQYTPYTMIRPQGIVESPIGNQGVDIEHLTDKIMDKIEQRLKTEQERRGIFI